MPRRSLRIRLSHLVVIPFLLALPCACSSVNDYAESLWGDPKHELLGPTDWLADFTLVDSGEEAGVVGVTWLPRGQKASDWTEQLQVLRAPNSGPDAIHPGDPAWRAKVEAGESKYFQERTLRGFGEDWFAFSFSITRPPRSEERHGLGVSRVRGDMRYRLWIERIGGPLTDAELDLWQKRFLEAPLR